MPKAKKRKKPLFSGKRPTMWLQAYNNDKKIKDLKIRIIYPNGKSEWALIHIPYGKFNPSCFQWGSNHAETLVIAAEYDRKNGHLPAEFLGEL